MYWCAVVVFGLYLCLAKYLHLSDNNGAEEIRNGFGTIALTILRELGGGGGGI